MMAISSSSMAIWQTKLEPPLLQPTKVRPTTSIIHCAATHPKKPPPPSRTRSNSAIQHLLHSSDFNTALLRFGENLKVSELNIILRNFGKSRQWKHLSQLFEWMQNHGKINAASYSSYIKFMGESKDIAKAINTYDAIKNEALKNNISICNSVLSCLVKNNKFDKALNMFERMKKNGLQPDIVTYSTLLAGCVKRENGYVKALELVKELENNGILMDNVAYGTLIAICASYGRCEEAEMYFIRMQSEGYSPNAYHYSSLLNAYSFDGNCQKADKLVQDMTSAGLTPNKVVLTTLLKVYIRGGLFEESRSLLSKLESLGYANDEMPYCLLMDGLSKIGKLHEVKLTYNLIKERQVKSDGYAHSIMISAFCRAGQLEDAVELARDYEALYNRYDLVIMNVLLCAYCRAGDMDSVMQTLRKMDKLALNPDEFTFRILIKYFCKEKLYLLAYRTLQDMKSKGHQLEEEALSSLILDLGSAGAHQEAFSVYKVLISSDTVKCKTIHEKILKILIAGQDWENAYVVVMDNAHFMSSKAVKKFLASFTRSCDVNLINDAVEAVHGSGHKIDQVVFHQIVSRYVAHPKSIELLLRLLQWMPCHGYVVDSSTRNLILKNTNRHRLIAEILAKQHSLENTSHLHIPSNI